MGNEFSQHHENVDITASTHNSTSCSLTTAPLVSLYEQSRIQHSNNNNNNNSSTINENVDICFICSDPIEIYSLSQCNHRTCHLCTLRTRALLESDKCAYCRTQQDEVLFTRDSKRSFQELKSSSIRWITISDINILCENTSIYHSTSRMMEFQCPSKNCNIICNDWHDLVYHVRIAHNKMFCNMCIVNRKIFSFEHQLYTREELINHYNGNNTTNSTAGSYFKGHPSCTECNIHFFDSTELYDHYVIHHQFVPNSNLLRQSHATSHNVQQHILTNATTNTTTHEHVDRHLIEASDIDIPLLIIFVISGLVSVIGNITVPGCHDFERFFHSLENLFVTLMNHDDVNNDQSFEIILRNMASSLYMVGGRCVMLVMYLMIIFWVLKGWFFIMSWVLYGMCLMMFGKICWENLSRSLISRN